MVRPEYIKDTIENAYKYERIIKDGNVSYKYYGQKAVLIFNKAKELITGWTLHK